MDAKEPRDEKDLRKYVKPAISRVALRPDEAVLGACKTSSVSGPAASTCAALSCSSNSS